MTRLLAGGGCYLLAAAIGLAMVLFVFAPWALEGSVPPGAPPIADFAQQVVGQRYFLAAPWHWPLLHAPGLLSPWGINVAFTDSLPLPLLITKVLRPVLPPFVQVETIWLAFCWVLQPAAAVFALRSAGERGLLSGVSVAILAACQPVFLEIFWHPSLSSHFLIFIAIGLYFRIVDRSRVAMWGGGLLLPVLLLVHPYVLAMGAVVVAAAPLTLWVRRDPFWKPALGCLGGAFVATAILGVVLGYTAGRSPGGYGIYSMNLAAPFYPISSSLVSGLSESTINATGGQGYAYLGLGLLLLVLSTLVFCMPAVLGSARSQAGLWVACIGLFVVALSHRVYFGQYLVYALPPHVGPLQMLRASDRLFWPVTYAMLIGSVALFARTRGKLALIVLPLAAVLQFADAGQLRNADRRDMRQAGAWLVDPHRLRGILAGSRRLIVLPVFGCTPGQDMPLMQPLWIAAETQIPTNTMYVARTVHAQSCDMAEALAVPPGPSDILLIQPGFGGALTGLSWRDALCRRLSDYAVCSGNAGKLSGLPAMGQVNERN